MLKKVQGQAGILSLINSQLFLIFLSMQIQCIKHKYSLGLKVLASLENSYLKSKLRGSNILYFCHPYIAQGLLSI